MTTIHATCVDIDGLGVLLRGPSGSGKSDLALRLIDAGIPLLTYEVDQDCLSVDTQEQLEQARALAGA